MGKRTSGLKFAIVSAAVILLIIFLSGYVFKERTFLPGFIKRPSVYFFGKLESARVFLSALADWGKLADENNDLKKQNLALTKELAQADFLKSQNEFLKKTTDISEKYGNKVLYGSIFSSSAYDFYLNKGSEDGVKEGDVAVSEDGVLIGRIKEMHDNFSRMNTVNDTDFKVTAKTLNSGTSGIAKGALKEGLNFDLVVQNEDIKEGDVVVSSGDDLFPAGLIIGKVDHVESSDVQLFKKVRIKPAFESIAFGKVLIIQK